MYINIKNSAEAQHTTVSMLVVGMITALKMMNKKKNCGVGFGYPTLKVTISCVWEIESVVLSVNNFIL